VLLLLCSLLLVQSSPAPGQTYSFSVTKASFHLQTGSAPPSLDTDDPWAFVAQVYSEDDLFFFLNTVTLAPPGRSPLALDLTADLSGFRYDQPFPTKNNLDAAFPGGTYIARIEDLFGDTTELQIELTGDRYPPAPFIVNYRNAQAISTAADFALEWPPLTGPTLLDTVGLIVVSNRSTQIYLHTIESDDPPPASIVIPANTLVTGNTNFAAAVNFNRSSAYRTYPDGSAAAASFVAITQLRVQAPFEPYLRSTRDPVGGVRFRFNAIPGRQYRIDSAGTLPHWQPGPPFTATNPYEEHGDFAWESQLFYRAVLLPP
jgi:hypothetical protein